MTDPKPFLFQTAQTASFALRQYFRPLIILGRFLKSGLGANQSAETAAKKKFPEPFPGQKGS